MTAPRPHLGPAVLLLSGGLDSAVTLAIARDEGHPCITLSLDYGQRHRRGARRRGRALGRMLGAGSTG